MHLVNQSGAKVLPDCGNAATQPYILTVRKVNSLFKSGVNAISDEVEGCPTDGID
jgi:hypothetical protein